jgi:hypothetical protein
MGINTQSFGNSQGHSESNQRDNGSVTHVQDQNILAADIERYVQGVTFPADKQDLVSRAKEQNAPNHIINLLEQLQTPEFGSANDTKLTQYNNVDELLREISKIE